MRHVVVIALAFASLPAVAAVDIEQAPNRFDRHFERLPDLRLVRGAQPKDVLLEVTAEPGEQWTISADAPWMTVAPTSGTGPGSVRVRFDGRALAALEDPTGAVTIVGAQQPGTNRETLEVRFDIWPNLSNARTRAELIAYAKDPANWPRDGFPGSWELWGFIPDNYTRVDAWERTPCSPGVSRDDCVREGQAGLATGQSADQAWLLSTGDPRVVIAVLDSGIRWSERDLVHKFYLNARELVKCPPPGASDDDTIDPFERFDVNGDGLFNIRDYDEAPWLTDVNFNGLRDPQDLLYANNGENDCSDGVDDDGNGYVDDIAGWDFFWNDNDPSDDSDFGHGTGEANDSTAEANDDGGTPGICMRCLVMPVRVGDSFIVDVNQFADGVIFAVESGADVVQEALGSLNNTPYAQAAIDWAYQNHVPVIASAADETSWHHNYPSNYEHVIMVHAIQFDEGRENSTTYLNFNNCTNFGPHLSLSTPGTGCSSEATGKTAGQAGLVKSYFRQLQDGGDPFYEPELTAEEMYQVLVASADDIDVPGAETDDGALALKKFPSNEGWDLHFGYGRNNARRALELLRDKKIPPEADISAPRWFQVFDPARTTTFEVRGTVSSPRLANLSWELHVAEGAVGKPFTKVAEGTGAMNNELLATIPLTAAGPLGGLVVRAHEPAGVDPEQFTATLELRVRGENPNGEVVQGVFRKAFGVRSDPTTMPGFPIYLNASGESSPKLTDLDGDGTEEIVLATADGLVHAITRNGDELPGFPAKLGPYLPLSAEVCAAAPAKCHRNARPFATGVINPDDVRQSVIASVAVGDLDGDGSPCRDAVVATIDGFVFAYTCEGALRAGFPVEIDRTTTPDGFGGARRCERNGNNVIGCRDRQLHAESGFFSSPALADLDGDGDLEIVVGGLDQHAYAWHHTGALVNGWPVHLAHPTEPKYDEDGRVRRYEDRIISSPAICDIFGDGRKHVFLGTNERIENSNAVYLYGIKPEGNAASGGPFPPGWPTRVLGFIPDEILPYVGRGNPNSPACADFDGDGADEIVNAGMGGNMLIIQKDGRFNVTTDAMQSTSDYYGPHSDVTETFSLPVINNPSIADLDGDGVLDIINGTAGSGLIAVASQGGKRNKFDHSVSAWDSQALIFHDGFPHRVWDYQFFMNYSVADLEGTGKWNVISGDGGYFVYAPNVEGKEAPGFPKWTQNWHIATPALGDLNGDQLIDVVAPTREGWLWAWSTTGHVGGPESATRPAIQWEGFHHDDHNTGNFNPTTLKRYPRLAPPDDACGGGCCCEQSSANGTVMPLAALAGLFALGTLLRRRRRG